MLILFGKHGQVAREVIDAAQGRPLEVFSSSDVDFRCPGSIECALKDAAPGSIVINAAAYTQVDQAESELDLARQINADAPGKIAEICQKRGLRFIHLSTDYVFPGKKKKAYVEDDLTDPLNVYGETKRAGELQVLSAMPQAIILRTSWVFSSHGKNFVKTMLRLGDEKAELKVVSDQRGRPTSARSIAVACLRIADHLEVKAGLDVGGIYHFSGKTSTSWFGFAEEIFRQAKMPVKVIPISTEEYPTPACRPRNSVLDHQKISQKFGIQPSEWKKELKKVLLELGRYKLG